jgi:type VI secretion system secreted protein Hcp
MAIDAFLKVDNIQGESQDSVFKNTIEVQSYSFGASQTAHVQGGGLAAGKATLGDLSIMKLFDKSSPKLFGALTTGTHIPNILLSLRKGGGGKSGGYVYLTYKLENAIVTGTHVSGGSETPTESYSFAYQKVTVEYFLQGSTGSVTSTGSVGWDAATNTPS